MHADLEPPGVVPVVAETYDPRAASVLRRRLEALLFIASDALPIARLAELCEVDGEAVAQALGELEAEYAGRGIQVRLVAGGYRFATAPEVRAVVEAYLLPPKTSLSPAALETLAVVAYSQPVTKGDVEQVRGVGVDGIMAALLERGFIAEVGRKESPGRPMLFGTTAGFLEAFGLPSLADLPPLPDERSEQLRRDTASMPRLEGTVEESADLADPAPSSAEAGEKEHDMTTLEAPNATMNPNEPAPIGPTETVPEIPTIDPGSPMPPVDPQPNNPMPSMADTRWN